MHSPVKKKLLRRKERAERWMVGQGGDEGGGGKEGGQKGRFTTAQSQPMEAEEMHSTHPSTVRQHTSLYIEIHTQGVSKDLKRHFLDMQATGSFSHCYLMTYDESGPRTLGQLTVTPDLR